MQSLRAPERPVSHYRNGKLRSEEEPRFDMRLGNRAGRESAEPEQTGFAGDKDAWVDHGGHDLRGPTPPVASKPRATLAAGRGMRVSRKAAPQSAHRGDRRDPSPSRLAYRLERLWLTPLFRGIMRIGLPILVVVLAIGLYFGNAERRNAVTARLTDLRIQVENRPEFMVNLMSIDGASAPVADAVRAMLPVQLPASSFALDLEALRARIESVDAVASASLSVQAGGVLAVNVTERKPAVLWRTENSLEMLDATGRRVATLKDRAARPDLPVLAGDGANLQVAEALAVLSAAQPILPHVRGIVRMGDRRWDMVLDRNQRIMLPEDNPVQAIEQAIAIDSAEDLLARDLAVVDLRNPDRPTLRLTESAVASARKLTETETKVAGQ